MGGGKAGNFGRTKGSRLDAVSDLLAAASLIPGLDTLADLASIPVDLARGDYVSAVLDLLGAVPVAGEVADTVRHKTIELIWFGRANLPKYCVKMLVNTQSIHCAFALSFIKICSAETFQPCI